jgi:arylsulfatase A-like enzyme
MIQKPMANIKPNNIIPNSRYYRIVPAVISLIIFAIALAGYYLLTRPQQPNVILIVLDTVRADRLGCYGNELDLTPEIDKFARDAVRFDQAFSHAPWTLPSVASIFTSRYPAQHTAGGRLGAFTVLPDDAVTIAEVFQRNQIVTGAITNVLFLDKKFGMTQGFDTVDSHIPRTNTVMRKAGPTTQAALSWLDKNHKQQFFLMVHYFDAHLTYDAPQPFRRKWAAPQDRESNDFVFGTIADMIKFRRGMTKLDANTIGRLEKLHNAEVAYLDSQIGKLLAGISERGLDSNTVVVITSDHGEEFNDHSGFEHGHSLYNELLHIPLLVRLPTAASKQPANNNSYQRGISTSSTVRHIDIAPTLCELAGIKSEPAFTGQSLAEHLHGSETTDRPVLSQGNMWGPGGIAWRRGDHKLIYHPDTSILQLYDHKNDAAEQNNIAKEKPKLSKKMLQEMDMLTKTLSATATGKAPDLTSEQLKLLRSLGYTN